jgi:hypothetical protein
VSVHSGVEASPARRGQLQGLSRARHSDRGRDRERHTPPQGRASTDPR